MFLEKQYQISGSTCFDRYPYIFSACKNYWNNIAQQKYNILSFGCATGEECFTLLKYFPSSSILGVDINKERIDVCNNKNTYSRTLARRRSAGYRSHCGRYSFMRIHYTLKLLPP